MGLLGLFWPILRDGVGSENCFGVSIFKLKTFIISALSCLVFLMLTQFRVFWAFGAVFGLFWGQGKGKNGLYWTIWGLRSGKKTVLESQYSD